MTARLPLVERREELLQLIRLMAEARHGKGKAGLVVGPVGSGKSAILSALCEETERTGVTVLRAGGSQAEYETPLGVLGQLLRHAPRATPPGTLPAPLLADLCAPLFELAGTTPLLLCVDDAHLMDSASWQCLMFLIRRLGSARIAVVLAERASRQHPQSAFRTELLRQSHCHLVPLAPLADSGVAELIESRLGAPGAPELVAAHGALSGGNPLLAHALLDDLLTSSRQTPDRSSAAPGTGEAFLQAVVACLHRSEAPARATARGIAVLGDTRSPHLLEHLLALPPASVEGAVRALESAGLLTDGRFRHSAVRTAVLLDMAPEELSGLQHRAAHLLYEHGAPEGEIADRLLATDGPGDAWSIDVLYEAARQALAEGETGQARRRAEHAQRSCSDGRQRARVLTLLAGIDWQTQPGNAVRHLPALAFALRADELSTRHGIVVVTYLLRHGRVAEATRALTHLLGADQPTDASTAAGLRMLRHLLAASYPGMLRDLPAFGADAIQKENAPAAVRADPRLQAAAILHDVLRGRADENTYRGAEQVLRTTALSHRSWEEAEFALLALVYADRAASAQAACDRLLERIDGTPARGWQPPLLALRSHIALRRGRLTEAARYASTALREMPAQAWGATLGMPLGSLLAALTAMGRHEEAAELLSRPVPHSLYQTRYGLHYLHARGEYRLATGNPHAALEDFLICGDLMREWDLDLPGMVPWRGSAARVHLHLGQRRQARDLVEEQLERLGPGPSRTRGITLRICAATDELKDRSSRLRRAVKELQRCDDLAELAATLADLGHTHHSLRDDKRSRAMLKRAWYLARVCGAETLHRELDGMFQQRENGDRDTPLPACEPAAQASPDELSGAELRVASLAAIGHTNREISRQLFITVSTVEQHMTRVYRKLQVSRRGDLLDRLGLTLSGGARTA